MAETTEGMMDSVARKAMRVMAEFLDSPAKQKDPAAQKTARIASSVLSTWGTMKQAINGEDALRVMVAREVAGPDGQKFKNALLMADRSTARKLVSGR